MTPDRYLSAKAVAERFSVSPRHLRRLVQAGRFPRPALRLGRSWRWRDADLRAFVDRGGRAEGAL